LAHYRSDLGGSTGTEQVIFDRDQRQNCAYDVRVAFPDKLGSVFDGQAGNWRH
jgi:hypothetical protein